MIDWRLLLCWPCIAGGSGLFMVSFASYAQSAVPLDAVTYWRDVATAAIGIVIVLVGWYMRSVDARMRETSDALLKNYHTKEETRDLVADVVKPLEREMTLVSQQITALHKRLDQRLSTRPPPD